MKQQVNSTSWILIVDFKDQLPDDKLEIQAQVNN